VPGAKGYHPPWALGPRVIVLCCENITKAVKRSHLSILAAGTHRKTARGWNAQSVGWRTITIKLVDPDQRFCG